MTPKRARCPSPIELERAFWSGDVELRGHALGCASCSREWAEIAALVEAGRGLPPPTPSAERREEIRTALLSSSRAPAAEPRRLRWQLAWAGAAAAVALVAAWWAWPRGEEPAPAAARGRLLAHDGARYMRAAAAPDEIVRLVDGTLTVEVEPLRPGERFRVITGDAEIEVKGTAFDATAAADRLRSVRVIHGSVEVRAGDRAQILTGGQVWQAKNGAPASAPAAAQVDAPAAKTSPADASPPRSRRQRQAVQGRIDTGPSVAIRTGAQQAFDDGWAAMREADFVRAAEAFTRAAERGAGALAEDARYWRAVALARGGDPAAATAAFEAFLSGFPLSPRAGEASVMLGWLLFEGREYAHAARRFRAAIDDRSARIRASAAQGLEALRRAGY